MLKSNNLCDPRSLFVGRRESRIAFGLPSSRSSSASSSSDIPRWCRRTAADRPSAASATGLTTLQPMKPISGLGDPSSLACIELSRNMKQLGCYHTGLNNIVLRQMRA